MRVLLVEDEPHAANVLAKGLREQAYAVDLAADGDTAIFQAGTTDYDAVILDVMLPVKDGFAVCRAIRAAGMRRSDPDADGARRGGGAHPGAGLRRRRLPRQAVRFRRAARPAARADPARTAAAAARAAERRPARRSTPAAGARGCGAAKWSLTAKEYALLEYLARRAGDVVSRADIAEHVWDEHYDPLSNVVDVYIQRLRRKLDRPGSESCIRTRRGEGYQLGGGRRPVMSTLSLRARLTLWYTLALLVVLGLFAADVLWEQWRIGLRRVDRELEGLVTTLTNVIRAELAEQVSLETAAEEARFTVARRGRAVAIFDAHGKPLAASWSGLDAAIAGRRRRRRATASGPNGRRPAAWRLHARSPRFGDDEPDLSRRQHAGRCRARTARSRRKR